MARIGRNEPCPCGSGKKYKNCCAVSAATVAPDAPALPPGPPVLKAEVEKLQKEAMDKHASMRALGVFILFSTREGDGWVLDASGMDALQVAAGGLPIDVVIDQSPSAIEITWSHQFVTQKNFTVVAYADKQRTTYATYPARRIKTLVNRTKKNLSPQVLASIHMSEDQ